ncbi:MAG: hypothetical protein RID81_04365 [Sandaracinaceae bacterium]
MGFRDQVVAAQAQVDALTAELTQWTNRAREAKAEAEDLRRELDGIKRGASLEQRLRDDPHFAIAQVLLPIAGLLGLFYGVLLRATVFYGTFHGHFDPTPAGLGRFLRQLDGPEAWGAFLMLCITMVLSALPIVAGVGLVRRRKWGWAVGTLTYVLWTLAFPPLGLYGLYAMCRTNVLGTFFPQDRTEPLVGGRAATYVPPGERASHPA